jgi:hypothetical protein
MSGPPPLPRRPPPHRRRTILSWVLVGCVAAVVTEAGIVTNGFGLLRSAGGAPGSSGPNPNPYFENVTAVWAQVTYTNGNLSSFPALQGTNLCSGCPKLPTENRSYDPPEAGIRINFTVENMGENATSISNFTLQTSGPNPTLFTLVGVVCCAPAYQEVVTWVWITPGTSFGFSLYAVASSIPNDESLGYALYFNATAP